VFKESQDEGSLQFVPQTFFLVKGFLHLRVVFAKRPIVPSVSSLDFLFLSSSFVLECHHPIRYFVWYAQTF